MELNETVTTGTASFGDALLPGDYVILMDLGDSAGNISNIVTAEFSMF